MAASSRCSKYEWTETTATFVTGSMSMKQLAHTTGIPLCSIKARAHRYKWLQKRDAYRAKVYADLLAEDMDIKKARLAVLREKAGDVVGNIVERLDELGIQAAQRAGLSAKEQEELAKLQAMVMGDTMMTKKQADRLFMLQEEAGKQFGLEPGDCEKVMKATDLALTVGERSLGLGGQVERVQVTLKYVPDRLRNREQEDEPE